MPDPTSEQLSLRVARALVHAGVSVLPIKPGEKKPAIASWKQYEAQIADKSLLPEWFSNGNGLAYIMGAVSGNAELIDFDDTSLYPQFEQACRDNGFGGLLADICLLQTPSGGHHLVYRTEATVCGNKKISHMLLPLPENPVFVMQGNMQYVKCGVKQYPVIDGKMLKCVIETRGEGGYALTFPTPGYKILRGKPTELSILTAEQRKALHQIAGLFNDYESPASQKTEREIVPGNSPGSDYNERGDYEGVLLKHGWRRLHKHGTRQTWTRPGHEEAVLSATTGYQGARMLYVFSTNAMPFESERKYSPFAVYALLEHGGDFKVAAGVLGKEGYGEQGTEHKTRTRKKAAPPVDETDLDGPPADEPDAKMTEFELAKYWSKRVENIFLFVEGEQWWRYAGNVWKYSSAAKARQSVQSFLEEVGVVTPAKVRNVLFLSESELGPVDMSSFDAQQLWIPLANGVYDISTGELLPHDPLHRLTHIVPYEYDARAECPTWRQCLNEWMLKENGQTCQEWIDILQEFFGYCLIPDTRAQVSMLWNGEGGNGKGVATRVLEGLVGRDYTTAIPIEQLHDPYQRAELQGKLVGFVNEPDSRAMQKNGNWFKAIVGGDPIPARRPTEKVFTFQPVCRVIISTNELPSTRDTSIGYYRRLIMIDWRYNVPADKRDGDLDDKLRMELPGIFNWALEGLRRFRERRKFDVPEESKQLLEGYKKENDPIGRYFKDELVFDPNAWTSAKVLYHAYKRWSEEVGVRVETDTAFGKRLSKNKCDRHLGTVDGERVRGWRGVRQTNEKDLSGEEDESQYTV